MGSSLSLDFLWSVLNRDGLEIVFPFLKCELFLLPNFQQCKEASVMKQNDLDRSLVEIKERKYTEIFSILMLIFSTYFR